METTKITSAGIIRDSEKPRAGVISANRLAKSIFDIIDQGVDLNWIEFETHERESLRESIRSENGFLYEHDLDDLVEKAWQESAQDHRGEMEPYIIFGDWKKDDQGKYAPDPEGKVGFAATFSGDSNTVCVEWSKFTTPCQGTSSLYTLSNGMVPCGDLETQGDSAIAYTLPPKFFNKEEN